MEPIQNYNMCFERGDDSIHREDKSGHCAAPSMSVHLNIISIGVGGGTSTQVAMLPKSWLHRWQTD